MISIDEIIDELDDHPGDAALGQHISYRILKQARLNDPLVLMVIQIYEDEANSEGLEEARTALEKRFNGQLDVTVTDRVLATILFPPDVIDGHMIDYLFHWACALGLNEGEFTNIFIEARRNNTRSL